MKSRPFVMLSAVILPLLLSAAVPASVPAPEKMPLAVKACYLKAKPRWDTGATNDMIQGNGIYADCLEDLAVSTLKSPGYDSKILEGQDPKKFLDQLLEQIDILGWSVENQLKSCAPMCGTMWSVAASAQRGDFLEHLLQTMSERLILENGKAELLDDPKWKACWQDPLKCQLN